MHRTSSDPRVTCTLANPLPELVSDALKTFSTRGIIVIMSPAAKAPSAEVLKDKVMEPGVCFAADAPAVAARERAETLREDTDPPML